MSQPPMESRYAIIPSEAIDDPELTLTDLRVLGVIGYHSSRTRPAWPKQRTIGDRLKVARETVNRSIRRLHRKGYIDIAHQFDEAGGQRESCYFLRLDPDPEVQPVEVMVKGKPLALVPRVTPKSHGAGDAAITPEAPSVTPPETPSDHTPSDAGTSHQEHTLRTSHKNIDTSADADSDVKPSKPTSAAAKSEFEGLWALWPVQGRKRSKAKDLCLAAFAKACQDHPHGHVVEAAAAFVKTVKPDFVPALDRWLRDRKYEHFLPQASVAPTSTGGSAQAPNDLKGQPVDWDAMVARYVRSGIWPDRLGRRPDELGYRGTLAPLEAIMANNQVGRMNVVNLKLNIDRLRATQRQE